MRSNDKKAPNYSFKYHVQNIRLGEFDIGGVLYHANYFHLYETGREALLASNSISYPSLVAQSKHLAIIESHQRFLAPIRYGTELEIAIWCSELKRTSVCINYELYKHGDNKLIHQAWTRHVCVNTTSENLSIEQFPELLRSVWMKFLADNNNP